MLLLVAGDKHHVQFLSFCDTSGRLNGVFFLSLMEHFDSVCSEFKRILFAGSTAVVQTTDGGKLKTVHLH